MKRVAAVPGGKKTASPSLTSPSHIGTQLDVLIDASTYLGQPSMQHGFGVSHGNRRCIHSDIPVDCLEWIIFNLKPVQSVMAITPVCYGNCAMTDDHRLPQTIIRMKFQKATCQHLWSPHPRPANGSIDWLPTGPSLKTCLDILTSPHHNSKTLQQKLPKQ